MQLENKVVLVTGAGNGLGAATALACARAGARVWLVDRDEAAMEATAARIVEAGGESGTFTADLTERQACFDAVNGAVERFGGLDGLCNVAGITKFHRVCDVTEADWQRTLAITLSAPFFLAQAAIPELLKRKGSIVNVASSGGIKGTAYALPYSAAKAAVIHMTRCMAMEFINEPIRINAVAPGGMITNIMAGNPIPDDLDFSLIARFSGIRPPVDPVEVANLIVYVLSDATPSLHGAILSADGGVTAD